MNVGAVAMLADVRMALTDDSAQIVDACRLERFSGKAAEPRPIAFRPHAPLVSACPTATCSRTAASSRANA